MNEDRIKSDKMRLTIFGDQLLQLSEVRLLVCARSTHCKLSRISVRETELNASHEISHDRRYFARRFLKYSASQLTSRNMNVVSTYTIILITGLHVHRLVPMDFSRRLR